MCNIPKYIIDAAREYRRIHGGDEKIEDAFIAGFEATKKREVKDIVPVDEELFKQCWLAYRRKGSKQKAFSFWCKLKDNERKLVMPHIKIYVTSRELHFQQDFERYLRDKTFLGVIVKGNQTIYDPEQLTESNEYRPTVDGVFLWWNEKRKCLMFNGHVDMINDGYTEDTRPDGARAAWNMYEWVWSSKQKKWVKQ